MQQGSSPVTRGDLWWNPRGATHMVPPAGARAAKWQEAKAEPREGERMADGLPPAGKKMLTIVSAKEAFL